MHRGVPGQMRSPKEVMPMPHRGTGNQRLSPGAHRWRTEQISRKRATKLNKVQQTTDIGTSPGYQAWGDTMREKGSSFRIVYNNCNGIPSDNKFVKCHDIGDGVRQMEADLLGLSETCLDWSNRDTVHSCREIFRKHCRIVKTCQSSSDKTFSTTYQPGGTMTLINGTWAGRATAEHNDAGMGRWSEIRILGKAGRAITMITSYRVCNQSIDTVGHTTAFSQQYDILERQGILKPQPRKQLLIDLERRINMLQEAKEEVLIMMDANESLNNSQGELTKWVKRLGLVDVIALRHGTTGEPATHINGSERIDHIFYTRTASEYVQASGILAFEALTASDHRALYVDIDMTALLGGTPSALENGTQRGIMSSDPRAVALYREMLTLGLEDSNIEENMDELINSIATTQGGFASEVHGRQVDALEQQFTQLKLDAERACARIQSYPWSPKLRQARNLVRYWSMWVTQLRRGVDLSNQRTTLAAEVETTSQDIDINTAQSNLRSAQQQLKLVINNATQLRQDHLEARAQMMAMTGPDSAAAALEKIIRAEQQRSMWARLRRGMGKLHSGGLTHILVENKDGTHTCISDREEMERQIISRNKLHFSQADGTPFTVSPLTDILGRHGTTAAAERILEGEFHGEIDELSTNEATKAILRKLRRTTPANSVCDHISADDLRHAYAKWRESTSTSPSGLHLGHEKALLRMEQVCKADDDEKTLSERVFALKAKFLNVAIQHCHVYARWQTIVNATIEKIPGKPLLHKLRVIHLIESDFNLMIGILWGRRLMQMGEQNESFGSDQYGSRKGKSAISLVVGKQAKLSAVRLAAASCCLLENDAKSCFDRIVMLLVSMISQKEGMTPAACKLFLSTLDKVKYHVKTQMGISQDWYGTTTDRTVHGPGQGGRGSPGVWVIISCLIMECLREISKGLTMHGPDGSVLGVTFTTGFVDDITLWIGDMLRSLENAMEAQDLLVHMTSAAQRWEELLYATGGKLELSKCFLYLVTWTAGDDGIPRLVQPHELDAALQIRDSGSGDTIKIPIRPSNEAYKTLGVLECPSGDYTAETQRLMMKANDFSRRVATMAISRQDAGSLYHTMIMPSMLYSASAGTLTRKAADTISNKLKHSILSAMGYNCHMPLSVVYGSKKYGGLGLTHMFSAQGAAKALAILQFVRCDNEIGKDILCQYMWAQVVAGTTKPVLEDPAARLPQLDSEVGIQTLREFLTLSRMSIKLLAIAPCQTKRVHDQILMDVTTASSCQLSDTTIRRANYCRLYLKVESLADVCSAEGASVTKAAWQCIESAVVQTMKAWPQQGRPGPLCRKAWQQLLRLFCHDKSMQLRQPLGAWTETPPRRAWPALYCEQTDTVAIRHNITGLYEYHLLATARRRARQVTLPLRSRQPITLRAILDQMDELETLTPVDIQSRQDGTMQIILPDPQPQSQSTAIDSNDNQSINHEERVKTWAWYITTTNTFSQDLLEGCVTEGTEQDHTALHRLLQEPTSHLIMVSDGGCRDTMGSYGFVLADAKTGQRMWTARGRVQGTAVTSYRAEAKGMLAAMTFVFYFIKYHEISNIACSVTHYCDNEALVKETAWHRHWDEVQDSLKPEFDLMRAIHQTRYALQTLLPGLQQNRWVKGHQEATCSWEDLPLEAQLNVEADAAATFTLQSALRKHRTLAVIPNSACYAYLMHEGTILTRDERSSLHTTWRDTLLFHHYQTRFSLSLPTLRTINWEALRMARSKLDTHEQRYSNKLQAGWLRSGTRASMENDLVVACHRCGDEESNDHVIQCPRCSTQHTATVAALHEFLATLNTDEDITQSFCNGMEKWLHQEYNTALYPHQPDTCVATAHRSQEAIGWSRAAKGLLSIEWAKAHAIHVSRKSHTAPEEMSGQVWSSKVSLWLIRECRKYWVDRNTTRQVSTSPDQPHTSRAKAEAIAQATQLYNREPELAQKDRVRFFRVPLEWRLQLPAKQLMQWVTENRQTFNRLATAHADRQRRHQPDIRDAWNRTTSATKTITTQHGDDRTPEPQPMTLPTTNTRSAQDNAQYRSNQTQHPMMERLQEGQRALKARMKARQAAKQYANQARLDRISAQEAKTAAKAAAKIAKSDAKREQRLYERKTTKHTIHQEAIRPHTQTLIEHARRQKRGPKFKPQKNDSHNNITDLSNTIPHDSNPVTETASLR